MRMGLAVYVDAGHLRKSEKENLWVSSVLTPCVCSLETRIAPKHSTPPNSAFSCGPMHPFSPALI
jgi:hypothetical protein